MLLKRKEKKNMKNVENIEFGEEEESSLSFHISFTLLSIESPSSVLSHTAPALDLPPHSGSPTNCLVASWKLYGKFAYAKFMRLWETDALYECYGITMYEKTCFSLAN